MLKEAYSSEYVEHPLIWPDTIEFRLYQQWIADVASEKNTLVILPTALGKTVISAIVAAEMLYNYREARVLVMAPTRPLIMQHRNSFSKLLKLKKKDTFLLTGKTPPYYRSNLWKGEARIMFSTPQVVKNDLLNGRLSLEKYDLLVFDECHRAIKNYAYTDIAKFYVSQARYPLILGMTASPGSQLSRIQEVCRNLYVERVEYRSEEDPDVKPYIHPIDIEWKRVNLPNEYLAIRSHIRIMLDKRLNWLYNKGILKRHPRYATRQSLIEVGVELRYILEDSIEEERRQIFTAIVNQSLALTLFHMLTLLETQGLYTLRMFLKKVELERKEKRSYTLLVDDIRYKKLRALVEQYRTEHPKINLLLHTVSSQVKRKPSSRMLVFAQYRDTTKHIVDLLNKIHGIRADRFVGQASKILDKGLTQEEQAERIRMLKEGELNILVATSIAEEGLDIPAVDHVIFYEPIPSEIRYIQRRGRTGRKAAGKVTILATDDTLDIIYHYASMKRTERMREIFRNINLKLQTIIRKNPRPLPNPLTPSELKKLEEEALEVKAKPGIIQKEAETVRDLRRKIERASKILYMRLLERGSLGASLTQIASDMEFETSSLPVLKAAIGEMMKEGILTEVSFGKYAVTLSLESAGKKTYDITIEKIYPGRAVVNVNDKWRARLTPEDYNGPRGLIKKNSRFRAVAEIYRTEGALCIRIKEVIKILN